MLALGAVLLPLGGRRSGQRLLLVFDPLPEQRPAAAFAPLTTALTRAVGQTLELVVATHLEEFRRQAATADLVICPDLVALALPEERFIPAACGRRRAPYNLRPRGLLVYRKSAPRLAEPWTAAPERTILGDSLSLAGSGPLWRRDGVDRHPTAARLGTGCAYGPDPYDHTAALHAARLGCFDYAVVRQWSARRFFASGLLSEDEWGVEELTEPLPDVVVMLARDWSAADRMALTETLVQIGRYEDDDLSERRAITAGLAQVGLAGFNILREPELQAIRRHYRPGWPSASE